ncbi:type II secretion system F family protein [Thiomicrorhabdus sp. zzn3]|uniref:type II secretion system F family protein n=1 Tax=Thiomicrorhabdus sp. zzn3 TaxID=3039775 RepID=UPI0024365A75|nr:type II secretion system F family protein [Thiomicrorhabdus sp. zzn3]MDG6778574.1 type II secretion system F family protein [Thiomicrorhabdus sp. zzn3]
MQNYRYTGINRFGKRVSGVMPAANLHELNQRLLKKDINLISGKKQTPGLFGLGQPKIKRKDIIAITFQFEQLLKAGVPLMEVIEDLRDSYENDQVKQVLAGIFDAMQGGATFSDALRDYEHIFGNVYVSLVSVGENTGRLDKILEDLANMLKWEDELASKAKKVMIYPSIVATVVIAVVILMMVLVVPELLGFIKSMGGEIGIATVALIATSDFISGHLLEIFIVPTLFYVALKAWRSKSDDFKLKTDKMVLNLSIIGPVIHKLKLARIANSLAVMYGAGVSFTDSLKMTATVAGNTYLEKNIDTAVELIKEGKSIHESFKEAEVFPTMAIRMVRVGENSGQMDEALKNISYLYDREAKELIEKIEPTIEPILTLVMGFIVGWIMLAVLGPIYDTISKVQL